jgi:GNAT superfamily N-acetyltransferase
LLGYVSWYPAGACHLCLDTDPNRPPADAAAQGEWRFSVTRRAAHLTQGEHAWIHRVAVEPIVQGCGVGRLLVEAAVEAARTTRSPCVLLECEQHREPFYLARGFHRATSFPDSLGPDVSVMRRAL